MRRTPSSGELLAPLSSEDAVAHSTRAGTGAEEPAVPDAPPRTIARYTVVRELGHGGMGVVYLAYDPKLDRRVALKVLLDGRDHAATTGSLSAGKARLLREARALARLSHPNVVQVYDVDIWQGRLYVTMEYVAGRSLRAHLEDGARTPSEILGLFLQAGAGLAAAHEHGIVHRDFKPGNVLVADDGVVKVVDFGLAKQVDASGVPAVPQTDPDLAIPGPQGKAIADAEVLDMVQSASNLDLTVEGRRMGTPAYMSPEQHLGLPAGPASDQFSFCVALWEALYGSLPFAGDRYAERYRNVLEGNRIEPENRRGVAQHVHRVLVRGLALHPEDRFPDMHALLGELSRDPWRKHRRIAAAAALLLFGLGIPWGMAAARSAAIDRCATAGEAEATSVLSDEVQAAVVSAFAATGLPYARQTAEKVLEALGDRMETWKQGYQSVCRDFAATGSAARDTYDLRTSCLRQALVQTRTVLSALADADRALVDGAVELVEKLDDPTACLALASSDGVQIRSEEARARTVELLEKVARASALLLAGRHHAGEEAAQGAAAAAREAGLPDVEARALLYVAEAARQTGKPEAATEALSRALALSAEADDARTMVQALVGLAHTVNTGAGGRAPALAYLAAAAAEVRRAHLPPEVAEIVETQRGLVLAAKRDSEEAVAAFERAGALAERAHGPRGLRTALTWMNLATARAQAGQTSRAAADYRRTLEVFESVLGSGHPRVGTVLSNLANLELLNGDLDAAERHLGRARTIFEEIDDPRLAGVYASMAAVARRRGRTDRAIELLRKARDHLTATGHDRERTLFQVAARLAALELRTGRVEDALATALSALSAAEATQGATPDRIHRRLAELACEAGGTSQSPIEPVLAACRTAAEAAEQDRDRSGAKASADAARAWLRVARVAGTHAPWQAAKAAERAAALARQVGDDALLAEAGSLWLSALEEIGASKREVARIRAHLREASVRLARPSPNPRVAPP